MSSYTSFQDLKSAYPALKALRVRVHGGLYGKDAPFDQTFAGDDSSPQSRFPLTYACTNPRGCTGAFDIGASLHHALQNGLVSHNGRAGNCDVVARGMTQGCRNMCSVEVQAVYDSP